MRLITIPGVFDPHSDSWMLAGQLRREPALKGAHVLDLCTGSGVLAIAAGQLGARSVTAVDLSRRAVLAARINARLNGVSLRAVKGSLFSPVQGRRFDLILSNPPYLPSASNETPKRGASRAWEGGFGGRLLIDRICAQAAHHLTPSGVLLLVHSSFCSEHATIEALVDRGFIVQVVFRNHGPLGPLARARAELLPTRGASDGDSEEILIFRAQRCAAVASASRLG
jgi:release factor glutamine methyltransferase